MTPQDVEIQNIKDTLKELKQDIKDIRVELNKVTLFVQETRGGRKYLWAFLSLAVGLGALIDQIIHLFNK